jgi:hypothetical protein
MLTLQYLCSPAWPRRTDIRPREALQGPGKRGNRKSGFPHANYRKYLIPSCYVRRQCGIDIASETPREQVLVLVRHLLLNPNLYYFLSHNSVNNFTVAASGFRYVTAVLDGAMSY